MLDHKLIEKVSGVYEFCEGDLEKFVLLLKKCVYPYEYMDSWGKFEGTSLPPKKDFYNKLNSTDISDYDYEHAKKVWDVFEIKNVSAPGLAWQGCLKKTGVKLELITYIDMLLIVEEGIRGGRCQVWQRYS